MIIQLTCSKCRFSMKLPDHKVNGRPICPGCNGGLMEFSERDQLKLSGGWRRKKTAPVVTVRPGVIRNVIFGILLLVLGPGLIIWATTWPPKASRVAGVFMGHGVVLTGWGIVLLVRAALRKSD